MPITPEQLQQLRIVDAEVNSIPYDDILGAHEPIDWWTDDADADGSYVCRDFVLTKINRLRDLGWAKEAMTVVLCWTESAEYHAVLAVDVDRSETWILDNRATRGPYRWDLAPFAYRWDRRQVAGTTEFRDIDLSGGLAYI